MTLSVTSRVAEIVSARLDKNERDLADPVELLAKPIQSLGLDSLDHLEVIMEIEDSFEVMLDEHKVMTCKTLAELAALVETERAEAA